MPRKADLCVEVRRENDRVIYSRVLDRAIQTNADLTRVDGVQRYVVIDRARGRMMDSETVKRRAQYLAELLCVPYVEDLNWPCSAARGFDRCQCPACAEKAGRKGHDLHDSPAGGVR
jgi:hypothetical protein